LLDPDALAQIALCFLTMKTALLTLCLVAVATAASAKEFKLYAMLVEETRVELEDGATWLMDKGDVFPVVMYKDMQKNIVLQLAGTKFRTETKRVRILEPKEVDQGLENYRKNVQAYLDSKAKRLKAELQPSAPAAVPAAAAEPSAQNTKQRE
jgi:hypothetical protein